MTLGMPKHASDNKAGSAVCLKPIARGGCRNGASCERERASARPNNNNATTGMIQRAVIRDLRRCSCEYPRVHRTASHRRFVPGAVKNRNGRRCVRPHLHERTYRILANSSVLIRMTIDIALPTAPKSMSLSIYSGKSTSMARFENIEGLLRKNSLPLCLSVYLSLLLSFCGSLRAGNGRQAGRQTEREGRERGRHCDRMNWISRIRNLLSAYYSRGLLFIRQHSATLNSAILAGGKLLPRRRVLLLHDNPKSRNLSNCSSPRDEGGRDPSPERRLDDLVFALTQLRLWAT